MGNRSRRAFVLGAAALAGLVGIFAAGDAQACDELLRSRRADQCDPLLLPRQPAAEPGAFLWALATHDQRREYLVVHGVPVSLADKIAVGGVPLAGQSKAEDAGWLLVPQAAAVRLEARF